VWGGRRLPHLLVMGLGLSLAPALFCGYLYSMLPFSLYTAVDLSDWQVCFVIPVGFITPGAIFMMAVVPCFCQLHHQLSATRHFIDKVSCCLPQPVSMPCCPLVSLACGGGL